MLNPNDRVPIPSPIRWTRPVGPHEDDPTLLSPRKDDLASLGPYVIIGICCKRYMHISTLHRVKLFSQKSLRCTRLRLRLRGLTNYDYLNSRKGAQTEQLTQRTLGASFQPFTCHVMDTTRGSG